MVKKRNILSILLSGVLLVSCSEYQKVLKQEDVGEKFALAQRFYEQEDYKRANRLFSQIAPKYIGKPQGENIMYKYADTYYQLEDYYLASYQFDRFVKSYPSSQKIEQAAFSAAKSAYMLSPKYSIDQTPTLEAIEKLQAFIDTYPESKQLSQANALMQQLRVKLEKKSFEIARQYLTIRDYTSAVTAFEQFLLQNPGTTYKEQALFLKLQAYYELAMGSVEYKKQQRLETVLAAYKVLQKYYPESSFMPQASTMEQKTQKQLEKYHDINK